MLKALISNKEKLLELILKQFQATSPPASVKAIEEIFVTCGGAHPYYQCLAAGGNTFPKLGDNIQGYVAAAAINYNQGNSSYSPPAGIARDVFVLVDKFTLPADFVIVDYESDPRVPLILGRHFLWTDHALIDVHVEEMILYDGDERLTLNTRHDTSSYSNQPQKESINMINIYDDSSKDFLEDLFATNHQSGNPTFSSHPELTSPEVKDGVFDPEGGNEMDSILEDSVDEDNLADLNDNLVDTIPKMFADEHALDYSSPPLYDEYDDDIFEVESDIEYVYDDPFDPKGEKIKESKLLIDELYLPSDFISSSEYDSFLFKDFSEVDALPSNNNEDKVFNSGILIRENLFEVITRVAQDKNEKKLAISHASLILEDFDPPLYELPSYKEVLGTETLLSFSFENEEKVFKPRTSTKGLPLSKEAQRRKPRH
nr:hypothetical protein [Tanacetum cinerariifolium]